MFHCTLLFSVLFGMNNEGDVVETDEDEMAYARLMEAAALESGN